MRRSVRGEVRSVSGDILLVISLTQVTVRLCRNGNPADHVRTRWKDSGRSSPSTTNRTHNRRALSNKLAVTERPDLLDCARSPFKPLHRGPGLQKPYQHVSERGIGSLTRLEAEGIRLRSSLRFCTMSPTPNGTGSWRPHGPVDGVSSMVTIVPGGQQTTPDSPPTLPVEQLPHH